MPLILPGNVASATAATGYDVDNSCRFNDGDSDSLNITPGSAGNRKTWTFSAWCKLSGVADSYIFAVGAEAGERTYININAGTLVFQNRVGSSNNGNLITNAVYRDPSAWYHFVVGIDSTQSTAANRIKMYVNGTQVTSFETETYFNQNQDTFVNNTQEMGVGKIPYTTGQHYDGYMAEVVLIDGTQYAASDFGEFDSNSGIWKPIDVSGLTFGTNGFYLDFKASGNLGNDANGGTDLTEVNLAAIDQSTDTCTNNFATLNPLIYESRDNTFAEGNLKITGGGSDSWTNHYGVSTIAVSTGKWFVEAKITTAVGSQGMLGIIGTSTALAGSLKDNGPANIDAGGRITGGGGDHQTGLTNFANGNIAGAAFDATNGTIQFYRNGSAYGNAVSSIASDTYYFVTNSYDAGAVVEFNFGSPPYSESGGNSDGDGFGNFSMAVPSGYFALNTKNLAEYG